MITYIYIVIKHHRHNDNDKTYSNHHHHHDTHRTYSHHHKASSILKHIETSKSLAGIHEGNAKWWQWLAWAWQVSWPSKTWFDIFVVPILISETSHAPVSNHVVVGNLYIYISLCFCKHEDIMMNHEYHVIQLCTCYDDMPKTPKQKKHSATYATMPSATGGYRLFTKAVKPLPWLRNCAFPDFPSLVVKSESVHPRFVNSRKEPNFASDLRGSKVSAGQVTTPFCEILAVKRKWHPSVCKVKRPSLCVAHVDMMIIKYQLSRKGTWPQIHPNPKYEYISAIPQKSPIPLISPIYLTYTLLANTSVKSVCSISVLNPGAEIRTLR